ncbi:hypothetical protein MmiAt1_02840 [Methanimicrococcus sp. At1]|uniref:DUF4367 domain-containing protein n=1 Tax=Methanimicrococcus hacksteinii TaxID=3028293 RepID=A0ABU3VMW8_9EURY|nr:hypothetical protein [Methanimicrococcus sp. At1]MDV0444747.1 hypothetical protein [Methanimicrococcus sp. At1]
MTKLMTILLIILAVFIAVGAAGCLGGDDGTDSGDGTDNDSVPAVSVGSLNYSTNIVTVSNLPAGFEFLSTQSVKSHGEGIGITDVLYGYRGYYKFANDSVTNATVYFYCFKTNTSADASKYLQQMNTSYENSYSASVSEITLNGHSAAKLTSDSGPDMIGWTRDNLIFVVKGQVPGQVDYDTIESLAVASGL